MQASVNIDQGTGIAGQLAFDGPVRAVTGVLNSASAAYNIIGATAMTWSAEGVLVAGGSAAAFAGILSGGKEYVSYGTTAGGPLAATMVLPNAIVAEAIQMGEIFVTLPNSVTASIGDLLTYNTTTGVLGTIAATAAFTASQTTTVLTVTAITAGNLGVGSVVVQASGNISRIVSLGTGTGGTGTYNLDTSQTVSSGAATANSTPSTGSALVPNAVISRFAVASTTNTLAVAKLTN